MPFEGVPADVPIIALDRLSILEALNIVQLLGHRIYAVKIHDLFAHEGKAVVFDLLDAGAPRVMMDAKCHDIPETVGGWAKAYAGTGAQILTVHCAGGVEMLKKAKDNFPGQVYGITVLTSLSVPVAEGQIFRESIPHMVELFADWAVEAGLDGVVCSPLEVGGLSKGFGGRLKFIVPATRLPDAKVHDQKRVATPEAALMDGASHLVWGRAIINAPDPVEAFERHMENAKLGFANIA
ncbi:MAG: orotidine-5'-phosphate decarboxylase [Acidobacteriaceae bacterium]